jgi:hypothetical protein
MRKRNKPERALPLPEAIDGQEWTVLEAPHPHSSFVSDSVRVMQVPFGTSHAERMVRLHEMVHAKESPPDEEFARACHELDEEIVQLCEDSRINGQLRRLGFPLGDIDGVLPQYRMDYIARESHPATLAAAAAATVGTTDGEVICEGIPEYERKAIWRFGQNLGSALMHKPQALPDFSETKRLAKEIIDLFGLPQQPAKELPINIRQLEQLPPPPPIPYGTEFGEMTIEEPPLTVILPGKMKQGHRRKVSDFRGRRLHKVGRLASDGRVFGRKIPRPGGGSILIDTSSSMDLSNKEVLHLCSVFPGGVIAAYSGVGQLYGTLRVIARKGRRVRDDLLQPPGGGNTVDGPALDWLAKQQEPRFWISDAGVQGGAAGLRYCLTVCIRNGIKRVDNAWEIVGRE